MAQSELKDPKEKGISFLDSGCSNHMTGDKRWFVELDESFRHFVHLGNNSKMKVLGKGSVKFEVGKMIQMVTDVYFVPELINNLLSIGQLQEKHLTIMIKDGACKIYH
ncbi:unnamed protein product [Rhodiola kirilowii]